MTGVQTCALPISASDPFFASMPPPPIPRPQDHQAQVSERSRVLASTLGLTLEGLQSCRTGFYEAGREIDMTAFTFEAVVECWD